MVELRWNNSSADRPILSKSQDLLGRADFAKAMSDVISSWDGKDSLVIAIYGAWGSGKSSLKNLILEDLAGRPKGPKIIEFNPWQWSGQKQIASAFFDDIGKQLGRKDASKEYKVLAKKWKLLGAYLKTGNKITDASKELLLGLLALFTVGAGSFGLLKPEWAKTATGVVVAASVLLAGFLLFGKRLASALSTLFSQVSHHESKPLADVRADIRETLKGKNTNVLVVLDDIDRLSPDETRLVFQLVKANGDLPRVIYLLLFERGLVADNLKRAGFTDGNDFLEKIVQAGFEVPNIERSRLDNVLTKGLNGLLEDSRIDALADPQRFGNLYHAGLRDFFKSLRDVYRFLSTFAVHAAVHRRGGGIEVNPIDLIGIEVLRLFEPEVYGEVRSNKALFTQTSRFASRDEQRREDAESIERIVARGSEQTRSRIRGMLEQLFPACPWNNVHRQIDDAWFRERRVAHPDAFDRYFVLAIPHGDVSHTEVEEVLSVTSDREALKRTLHRFLERGLINAMLDRLEAYKEEIPLAHAIPFITGMFDFSDSMPRELSTLDDVVQGTPATHAIRIVFFYLKREEREEERVRILRECLSSSTGLFLPAKCVSNEQRLPSRRGRTDTFLVPEGEWDALKAIILERIRQHAGDMRLARQNDLQAILFDWLNWGEQGEVRSWVARLIESREGIIKFLTSFVGKGSQAGMGDRVARVYYGLSLRNLEYFVEVGTLEQKVQTLTRDQLSESERQAVEAFDSAIDRRRRGVPEDGFPFPERGS